MITCIIIDEPRTTAALKESLAACCTNTVEVIYSCILPEEALSMIAAKTPDLLFLNIEAGGLGAFGLLEKIANFGMEVIFTSSEPSLAMRAFQYPPVDFLLKPVNPLYLRRAVERCQKRLKEKRHLQYLEEEIGQRQIDNEGPSKIILHTEEGLIFLKTQDILRIEAQRGYSLFYLNNGRHIIISKSLKTWEKMLQAECFYRVHDSHLVNLRCVERFLRKEGGLLLMSNEDEVPVSRRRKDELLSKLINFMGDTVDMAQNVAAA
ncbi:MAG: response regulator transcription factor [Saprospiraceae bacterium]|nr:MAG: response regulator transcription factor [Saprospiraceae bacterium]